MLQSHNLQTAFRRRVPIGRRTYSLGAVLVVGAVVLLAGGGAVYARLGGVTKPTAAANIDLQRGLVGWWNLDGNAKDSTPYAKNGTVTVASLTTDRKGAANKAYSFNSTSTYIDIPYAANFSPTNITLSAWAKPASTTVDRAALAKYDSSQPTGGWQIGTGNATGTFRFYTKIGTTVVSVQSSTNFSINTWHHLVGTYDGTTAKLYADNTLVGSTTFSGSIASQTDNVRIGARADGGQIWNGSLDDLRIYNRAISAAEVAALYQSYNPGIRTSGGENGLVGWWKMDGNAKDSTPYATNGTITGTTLTTDHKGAANKAYNFDGTDYITLPNVSALKPTNAITISTWLKPGDLSVDVQRIISTTQTGGYNLLITTTTSGNGCDAASICLSLRLNGAYRGVSMPSSLITAGTWNLITATYDGSTVKIYLNGQLQNSTPYASTITESTAPVCIGSEPGTTCGNGGFNKFIGDIDEMRLYNRALSQTEIQRQYTQYNSQINLNTSPTSALGVNLGQGLIGYWPFNGNAKDATPYTNNGTVSGATLTTDRKGAANSAYTFSGSGDYVSVTSVTSLNPTAAISLNAWFRPTNISSTGVQTLVSKKELGGYFLAITGSTSTASGTCLAGNICMGISYGGSNYAVAQVSKSGLSNNTTYHLVGTFDGTTVRLYLNGAQVATTSFSGAITPNTSPLCIGSEAGSTTCSSGGDFFSGAIDDVRIWNRAITSTEVSALYSSYR